MKFIKNNIFLSLSTNYSAGTFYRIIYRTHIIICPYISLSSITTKLKRKISTAISIQWLVSFAMLFFIMFLWWQKKDRQASETKGRKKNMKEISRTFMRNGVWMGGVREWEKWRHKLRSREKFNVYAHVKQADQEYKKAWQRNNKI